MGLIVIADGDTVDGSDLNTISHQGIVPLSTSAIFGLASPPEGMHAHSTDDDRLLYWNGSRWKLRSANVVGKCSLIATGVGYFITASEVAINGSQITFTAASGDGAGHSMRYELHWDFTLGTNGTTPFTSYTVKIYRGGTQIDTDRVCGADLFGGYQTHSINCVDTPGAGVVTYQLKIARTVGDGNGAIPPGNDGWAREFDLDG